MVQMLVTVLAKSEGQFARGPWDSEIRQGFRRIAASRH